MPTTDEQLKQILEAAIMASTEPMSVDKLMALFTEDKEPPTRDAVKDALKAIEEDYESRGIELKKVSSGYRFQARTETSPWVSRLWEEKPARYSRALLETLVLIAYKQPITRGEIEHVRGVAVSTNIIKTLLEREWVRVVGHRDVPGKPALYATTKAFLDYFNLKSLEELPTLAEIRDLDKINAELDLEEPGAQAAEQQAEGETADGEIAAQGSETREAADDDSVENESSERIDGEGGQLQEESLAEEFVTTATQDAVDPGALSTEEPSTDEQSQSTASAAEEEDSSDDIDSNIDDRDVVLLDNASQADTLNEAAGLETDEPMNEYIASAETVGSNDGSLSQAGDFESSDPPESTTYNSADDAIVMDSEENDTQGSVASVDEIQSDEESEENYAASSDPVTSAADEEYHDDSTANPTDSAREGETSLAGQHQAPDIKSQATSDNASDDNHSSDKLETAMAEGDNEYSLSDDYDSRFGG